jgi:nucleoside-diphosphate-sugar epimerase
LSKWLNAVPPAETARKTCGRVLVTGATGFLGRAVAEALVRAGHDVLRGTRVTPAGVAEAWVGYGEIGPDTIWDAALDGIGVVVHLAGLAHLPDEMAAAAADIFTRVNAEGTARLAAAAARSGVRRLVLMSSALVHGQTSPGRPFTESDALAPATPYARSKLLSETRLAAAAHETTLEWVILRPPMVYGPGARGNFLRLVQLVRAGVPLPLGAATAPKSFIGLDNLADAAVRAVEHPRAANQVFLVADAESTSTAGLVHHIAAALGRRVWTPYVPPALLRTVLTALGRSLDADRLLDPLELDASRIRTLLDWAPPVTLAEGVRRAVASQAAAHSKAGSMGTR